MATRKRVAIIYSYNENWIGGAYYVQNLIRSLNCLPENEQLELNILTKDKQLFQELKKVTGYPNLKFIQYPIQYNFIINFINRVTKKIFRKKIIVKYIKFDWIFPLYVIPESLKKCKNIVFWIPDLQEKFLPNFFKPEEVENRHQSYENMIRFNHPIVFSSKSAMNDFNGFFPKSKNIKKVIQFAVIHPDLSDVNIQEVKEKHAVIGDYFMSPNQFWQHKNQIAIIEAVKILRDKGVNAKVVFTGKEHDYRNPDYTFFLKDKVKEYLLEENITFLGFIDRKEQLVLMNNAQAIIQPSLFEGWSTVVEDGKAMGQTIIASNIEVHKEQLENKGYYFSPNHYYELADRMLEIIKNPTDKIKYDLDYNKNIMNFALNFKELTNIK